MESVPDASTHYVRASPFRIAAIGIAQSYCWESPKPTEFGTTGDYWEKIGRAATTETRPAMAPHWIAPLPHLNQALRIQ